MAAQVPTESQRLLQQWQYNLPPDVGPGAVLSLLGRKASAGAHWSQAYIEHVRAVHFALILVSVTGIIIGKSPDLEEMQTAQRQLRSFSSFILNKSPDSSQAEASKGDEPQGWVIFALKGKKYAFAGLGPGFYRPIDYRNCSSPILMNYRMAVLDWKSLQPFLHKESTTLSSLRDLWNSLVCAKMQNEVIFPGPLLYEDVRRIPYQSDLLRRSDLIERGVKIVGAALEGAPVGGYSAWVGNKHVVLKVSINTIGPPFAVSGGLPVLNNECEKEFTECFPLLRSILAQKPNYQLKELSEWLDSELRKGEARQFELFGIKPPPADESYWGALLVVAVMLYFWLHLRQLSPRIKPGDRGLDVPWVGLYRSVYAYLLVWISVLILPGLAVTLLGLKGVHYHGSLLEAYAESRVRFILMATAPLCVCIVIGVSSCLLSRRLAVLAGTREQESEMDTKEEVTSPAKADS